MEDPAAALHLEAVARLNGVSTTPWVQRFEKVRKKDLKNVDILFGGDICFWDELVKPVGQMINRAIDAGAAQLSSETLSDLHFMRWRSGKRMARIAGLADIPKAKATGALLVIHND